MKLRWLSKLLSLLLIVMTLPFQGCEVDTIRPFYGDLDELVDFRSDEAFCDLFLMGIVQDAKTRQPIANAEIRLDFLSLFTDNNGRYKIKVNAIPQLMDSKKVIGVINAGYSISSFEIDFREYLEQGVCNNSRITVELDFLLTPTARAFTVGVEGGIFTLVDSTLNTFIINGVEQSELVTDSIIVNIPAGAFSSPTVVNITPLAAGQYLGSISADDFGFTPIKRFEFKPSAVNFEEPITISFRPDIEPDTDDMLALYSLNTADNPLTFDNLASNKLQREEAQVTYDPATGLISTAIRHFSNGIIGIENGLELDTPPAQPEVETELLLKDSVINCDCGSGIPYSRVILNENITELQVGFDGPVTFEMARPTLLAIYDLLKVNLNLPAISSNSFEGEVFGTIATAYFPSTLNQEIDINGFVDKCDIEIFAAEVSTNIYTGAALGSSFVLRIPVKVERTIDNQVCPITSNCHQGCN